MGGCFSLCFDYNIFLSFFQVLFKNISNRLRSLSHSAFQCQGLTTHILEVGRSQLYADAADLLLHVAIMSHRRHLDICLESIRICLLEFLQLCGPCQRTYNVDIDAIGTPLGSCDSGQSADTFLGRRISALSEITEETCAGGKVNNGTLGLLQIRIAGLHIVECCIQTGIYRQVKLLGGMICDGYTGSGSLGIVDQYIDPSESVNRLLHHILYDRFVV